MNLDEHSMNLEKAIKAKLEAALAPQVLRIVNESFKHASGKNNPDAETHFLLIVVSDSFIDMPLVARHQKLYQVIEEERQQGIHAISMSLFTPEEYQSKDTENSIKIQTPDCLNS